MFLTWGCHHHLRGKRSTRSPLVSILWANLTNPIRILSSQQVIRAGQPLLPSVGFVGCSGMGFKKRKKSIACTEVPAVFSPECPIDTVFLFFSWPSASWEKEVGILPLNSGTIFYLTVTCIPYISSLGRKFCSFWGWGIPTSHSYVLYLLFKLLVSKIMPILSSLQGGIMFNMFLS